MIVLTTSTLAQAFKVIPRTYVDEFTLSVRDDSTNVTQTYEVTTGVTSGNYLTFSQAFSPVLVEGHFYDIKLYSDPNFWNTNYFLWELYNEIWNIDTTNIVDIFKDRIFCTDQDIDQMDNLYYELNKGQYITDNSYNNDYIVI
jgi:hypothetical protein|tara:strand:+ start:59 stop:487 length:429 start_codon:yes stop_codon:yes gene_type:complete